MPDARTTFAAVDAQEASTRSPRCSPRTAGFVFGNREPLVGRDAVIAGNKEFLPAGAGCFPPAAERVEGRCGGPSRRPT